MSMTGMQLTQFKAQLTARRRDIQALLRDELADAGHEALAGQVHDRGEESFADLLVDVDLAIAAIDLRELHDIDAALDRIEHGRYGECIDCGVEIPVARLQSLPQAARCVKCQESDEAASGAGHPNL